MRAYRALLRKDLLLEWRGRELVPAMLAFVLGAMVLVRFGLGGETLAGGTRAATGLLWVIVVFTSMLALVRSFAQEREHGIWDGLLSTPADRSAIWAARATATFLFLALTQVVAVPLFWLFFLQEGRSPSLGVLVAALLLADLGVAMLGSLLAGLATHVRAREVLLPVMFLPFMLPLVTVAVRLTVDTISPQTRGFHTSQGLGFLALYDTIFGLLGWALFEFVVED
ncbi:MAG TPA: heme exporter protein CcmB [Gaiellales bacterium]|nr:heme exporter protein CcmB [Gaiellales bacterium]